MRGRRAIIATTVAAVAVLGLTACSPVSTESDQVALHYEGGSFSSKKFKDCVASGIRQTDGAGDKHYVYPTSQRSFTTTLEGEGSADAKAFTVVSKDNVELFAPATVTFTLNTGCSETKIGEKTYAGGILQAFHERLGNRYKAYWGPDMEGDARPDGTPEGWTSLLNFAIGTPLDTSYDRIAQGYEWRKLWNDPTTKTAVETQLTKDIQTFVDQQTGAPEGQHFFTGFRVLIGKPDPVNPELKDAVSAEQTAVSKAQSQQKQAEADKLAAEAQIAVAEAKAAALAAEKKAAGDDWIRKYAIDKGMNPFPPPVVAGTAAGK
ncbi:hypothetical protein GCM10027456_25660 [Kineosporia babensis]